MALSAFAKRTDLNIDHYATAITLRKMFAILNEHWNDPKYAMNDGLHRPVPTGNEKDDDEAESKFWDARYEKAKEILRSLVVTKD